MNPKLELHIGELSLVGFSHKDQKSLGSAMEIELTRLLKEGGLPSSFLANSTTTQLNFGTIDLAVTSGSRMLGRQIARTVYSGFDQPSAPPLQAIEAQPKVSPPPDK